MALTKVKPPKENPFDAHLTSKPIKGTSSTYKKASGIEKLVAQVEETVSKGVVIPKEDVIMLTVEGGATINLGNYESARIGVHVQLPTTKETMNESYEWATDWISEKVNAAIKEAKA